MIIAFNKPFGILSQFTPEPGSSYGTLASFGFPAGVYPVGRLDADSEGMLLLSDEAGFNSRLLDPTERHPRTYLAQVEGIVDARHLDALRAGVMIAGRRTLPCGASIPDPQPDIAPRVPPIRERKSIPTMWVQLELIEGRNRQVRKMTAAVGYPTLRLLRIRIGELGLTDLGIATGAWCELGVAERDSLLR